jgi:hypothetical protein
MIIKINEKTIKVGEDGILNGESFIIIIDVPLYYSKVFKLSDYEKNDLSTPVGLKILNIDLRNDSGLETIAAVIYVKTELIKQGLIEDIDFKISESKESALNPITLIIGKSEILSKEKIAEMSKKIEISSKLNEFEKELILKNDHFILNLQSLEEPLLSLIKENENILILNNK